MSANIKIGGYPYSLGKIIPGATFATACVPLTANIQPVNNDGSKDHIFNGIFIRSFPGTSTIAGNTGAIFICNSAAAPDLVNFTNIIDILSPGDSFPRSKEWANNRDISKLFIGAENATDFALAFVDAF
jgi:hypothetical protein